jgi:uncharacterized coiled-coil protein SlyX
VSSTGSEYSAVDPGGDSRQSSTDDWSARERLREVLGFPQPVETIETARRDNIEIDLRERRDDVATQVQRCEQRIDELTTHIAALTTTLTAMHERLVADQATPPLTLADLAHLTTRVVQSIDARLDEHARRLGHALLQTATFDGADRTRAIDNPIFLGFDDQLR